MKILLVCLLLGVVLVIAVPTKYANKDTKSTCGYASCTGHDPTKLNVHIVPHSHDDVGWLKTVDQYYFGARNNIQQAGVQYIIDSVITALERNPERRFIQVESAFFYQWWQEQTEDRRELLKELVDSGRLEMTNGAWSMNDEASVNYQSVIDQFTHGLRTINDTVGSCGRPKIGWQIDPFGHSKEMASIFSQMGYDALFFSRLDYRDKTTRLTTKTPEMLWQGSSNLGDSSNLFTSVLYNHYSAPSGFCFDILCSDTPIITDEDSTEYNYESKVEGFANFVIGQAQYYTTTNIIITMGDDFHYQDALSYFSNLDKLIAGFKKFPQTYNDKVMNVFYSTPSCYIKAVNDEAASNNLPFPLKTDDFFPYASDRNSYWTGYFTSRPTSKRYERQGNNILQITKQLKTFVEQDEDSIKELKSLQNAMGMMQHHDAITGTEKQHVADDYHYILTKAIEKSIKQVNKILSVLLPTTPVEDIDLNLESCLLANVSICAISQSNEFIAAIYNPLSRPVSHYVRLPVSSSAVTVLDPNDELVTNQILPAISTFDHLAYLAPSSLELVFKATDIPALGVKLYKITVDTTKGKNIKPVSAAKQYRIGDTTNNVELDSSGYVQTITLNGETLKVKQELMYYVGSSSYRASGAYIFRPDVSTPEALSFGSEVDFEIYTGELVSEIHQSFSTWAKQIIRIYNDSDYIEFDWLVGPINISYYTGKEVISRFTTELKTDDVFYTDANGREMIKRVRNHRETYEYTGEEPISGNYYPVTSKIQLVDTDKQLEFAVLNDRAQGGSSLESGEVELMVHRRLLQDDGFGVSEALNEEQYGIGLTARGQHYVTFGPVSSTTGKSSSATQKDIAQRKLLAPWAFLTQSTSLWGSINKEFSGLTNSLPENVQILTLEPWRASDKTILLRLEHVLEDGKDENLSANASVDLSGLFTYFEIESIEEMTLAGNQLLAENERLEWIIGDELKYFTDTKKSSGRKYKNVKASLSGNIIELTPMQIRTFLLTINYKKDLS